MLGGALLYQGDPPLHVERVVAWQEKIFSATEAEARRREQPETELDRKYITMINDGRDSTARRQSDKISHIDMEDDHIDTVISHIISPYPISISRMSDLPTRSPISISDHDLSFCSPRHPIYHVWKLSQLTEKERRFRVYNEAPGFRPGPRLRLLS
jgi:hypothetical protein